MIKLAPPINGLLLATATVPVFLVGAYVGHDRALMPRDGDEITYETPGQSDCYAPCDHWPDYAQWCDGLCPVLCRGTQSTIERHVLFLDANSPRQLNAGAVVTVERHGDCANRTGPVEPFMGGHVASRDDW